MPPLALVLVCLVSVACGSSVPALAATVGMLLSAAPLGFAAVVVTSGTTNIELNDAIAGTVAAATSYPCWFTGTGVIGTPIAATDCTGTAGAATAFGSLTTMVCAAAGTAWSLNWNVAANPHVSIIECTNAATTADGAEMALSFTTSAPTNVPTAAPSAAPTTAPTTPVPTSAPTSVPSLQIGGSRLEWSGENDNRPRRARRAACATHSSAGPMIKVTFDETIGAMLLVPDASKE